MHIYLSIPSLTVDSGFLVSRWIKVYGSEGAFQNLLNKAEKSDISSLEWADILLKNKNITCYMREDEAKLMIHRKGDGNGESLMKILDEHIFQVQSRIQLKGESPFVERFTGEITRLVESGVTLTLEEQVLPWSECKIWRNRFERIRYG